MTLALVLILSCGRVEKGGDSDGDADTDVDSDVDSDSDVDTDTDTGSDTGTDTASDTGTATTYDVCEYDIDGFDCSQVMGAQGCPATALCLAGLASGSDVEACLLQAVDAATCSIVAELVRCGCDNCPTCADFGSAECQDCACTWCAMTYTSCFGSAKCN
jgi:hypothetical protein